MRRSGIAGCCNGTNFYNLGGAHGHRTAESQEQFEEWLLKAGNSSMNIAITNSEQGRTRTYLKAAGWETYQVGHLYISVASSVVFNKIRERFLERQRQQHQKTLEQRKKLEAERLAMRASSKFSTAFVRPVFEGKVYLDDVREICGDRRRPGLFLPYENLNRICKGINNKYKISISEEQIRLINLRQIRTLIYREVTKARKI